MKNKLLTLACLLLLTTLGFAQNDNAFRVGVDLNPNVSFITNMTKTPPVYEFENVCYGFRPFIYGDLLITRNITFLVGLAYNTMGGAIEYDQDKYTTDDRMTYGATAITMYKLNFIDIPLMVKENTNDFHLWSFSGALGVAPGFCINANSYTDLSIIYNSNGYNPNARMLPNSVDGILSFERKACSDKDVKIFNLSGIIRLSAEYRLASRTALTMGISGQMGMLNMFNKVVLRSGGFEGNLQQVGIFAGIIF